MGDDSWNTEQWTGQDVAGGLTGTTAANASRDAAEIQRQSGQDAIRSQERALAQIRGDLAPFRRAGRNQLAGLEGLINDPTQQLAFIQNNPFFAALANDAQNRLFSSQAAQGKLGSGDTASGLQNALLLLGNDLVQQSIGNRFNMAAMGQNAAAQTGTMTQNASNSISDLLTGIGNAGAAGRVGAANAQTAGANNMMGAGLGLASIFLSDRRFKWDLRQIGEVMNGIPLYLAKYVGSTVDMVCLMAHEVEKVIPGAVLDVFDVKFVDYAEVERVANGN